MRTLCTLMLLVAPACRINFDPIETVVVTPIASAVNVVPAAVAVAPDGRVVIAGSVERSGGFDWAVVRFTTDGELDERFGDRGVVLLDLGSEEDLANAVAVDSDGSIVVAGEMRSTSDDYDTVVVRLRGDGSPDPGFGSSGVLVWPLSKVHSRDDRAHAVAIDAAGRIVVAGYLNTGYPGWEDVYVARLDRAGAVDVSFGAGGVSTTGTTSDTNAPLNDFPRAIAIDRGGRIVVGLTCSYDACIVRFAEDGALDASFGTAGQVRVDFGGHDELGDLTLAPDGDIVIAGSVRRSNTDREIAVARFDEAGVPDPAFGTAGITTLDLGAGDDDARAVAIVRSTIVVAGSAHSGTSRDLAIVQLTADGQHDASAGGIWPIDRGGSEGRDFALDRDGRLVLLARAAASAAVVRHLPGLPWPTTTVLPPAEAPPFMPPTAASDLAWTASTVLSGATMSPTQPVVAAQLTISGAVRLGTGPHAVFVAANEITWTDGATLHVDGGDSGAPGASTPGAGGTGASGGGSGSVPYSGFAGFGGRFGRDGMSLGGVGGLGSARVYASDYFYGLGGNGGRGRGCCPPSVPGGEGANGGGGGGGGSWTNLYTSGGGGGGGLVVIVADRIAGPGRISARGGVSRSTNGASGGGGGGGVVWVAARSYDGMLAVDVAGGAGNAVEEAAEAGTARIFQLTNDNTLLERRFDESW